MMMVAIARWRASLSVISSLGLLLAFGAGPAYAQQVSTAPDGQQFEQQSSTTRAAFMATFGKGCAQQEWVWQHSLALAPDSFNGAPGR